MSVAGSGASGCGRIKGQRLVSTIKLAEVWWFAVSDKGMFDEGVLGGWIRREDVEAFYKDLFELMEDRLITIGEGKVMDVTGGARGGVVVMESSG